MRAAILSQPATTPQPGDFDEPVASDGQVVADVLIGGLNPVDS